MDEKSRARLAATLEKVIATEVSLRAGDLNLVEQNINTVREYLNKLRQGVCADFYDDNFKTTLQKPSHRAVKGTFKGKTPIKQETVECGSSKGPTGSHYVGHGIEAVQETTQSIFDGMTIKEEPVDEDDRTSCGESGPIREEPQLKYVDPDEKETLVREAEKRRPRYIPPVIPREQIQQSLEPRGSQHMKKVRFIVRNNSKYIMSPEDSSGCTYKWSLSVKLNDDSYEISDIVSKVVFYLHPSYKPHDIVTINSPPFKITRRGWGEFNMRVRLYFISEKDEPVDITHRLVFDKVCSGMETFGGETVLDHWIIDPSSRAASGGDQIKLRTKKSLTEVKSEPQAQPASDKPTPSLATSYDSISTMPFNDETSSSFLSAFFGDFEAPTSCKEDQGGAWGMDIFGLSDLGSELFGSPNKEQKPSGVKAEKVCEAEVEKTSTLERKSDAVGSTSVSSVEKVSYSVEGPLQQIKVEDSAQLEVHCPDQSTETDLIAPTAPAKNIEQHTEDISPTTIKQELYLSDLSEFDDEVIITDSNECVVEEQVVESAVDSQVILETVDVDYTSVEMDDLIHFPDKLPGSSSQNQSTPVPQMSPPCITSQSEVVEPEATDLPVKSRASDTLLVSSINQMAMISRKSTNKTPAASRKLGQKVPKKATVKKKEEVVAEQVISSKPLLKATPLRAIQACTVQSTTGGNVIYVVAPSNSNAKIAVPSTAAMSAQNVLNSAGAPLNASQTLLVRPSQLPSIFGQSCVPKLVMTPRRPSGKESPTKRVVHKKRLNKDASVVSIGSVQSSDGAKMSVSTPAHTVAVSTQPIILPNDAKPVTLVAVNSLLSSSKAAPILMRPQIISQTPTSFPLSNVKKITNVVTSPKNNLSAIQLKVMGPPTKVNNVAALPSIDAQHKKKITIRPSAGQCLVKMPDGTFKPIALESLKPLNPGDLQKLKSLSSGSQIVATSKPVNSIMIAPSVSGKPANTVVQRKRTNPSMITFVPAKKTKTIPGLGPQVLLQPQTVFKLPIPPSASKVSPSASKGQTKVLLLKDKGAGSTALAPRRSQDDPNAQQGMSILKRRPPDSEEVQNPYFNERTLIENCPFDSVVSAVNFLLKNLPLVDGRAEDRHFKQAFPYCAVDHETFRNWPFAKQRAHEVLRANDVLSLTKKVIVGCNLTKWDVVKLARTRGYTPLPGKIDTAATPHFPTKIEDRLTVVDVQGLTKTAEDNAHQEDDVIDVETGDEAEAIPRNTHYERIDRKGKVFMTIKKHAEDAAIVEKWAEDMSIYLDPEEVEPDIIFPGALRLLVSAFHSFAEDLTRRAYTSGYLRYNSKEPRQLLPEDVICALRSRPEFDLLTNVGLGKKCRVSKPRSTEEKTLQETKKIDKVS